MEARPPDRFESIRIPGAEGAPGAEILADAGARDRVLELGLDRPERLADSGVVERWVDGGRVPHPVVRAGDELWLVKSYRRGGFVSLWNTDVYFGRGRFLRELEVSLLAARAGLTSAPPVALITKPAALGGVRAWLVSRYIEDALSLGRILGGDRGESHGESGPKLELACRAAGRIVRRMHDVGIDHPDLNLHNVLCTTPERGRALIVDWDRALLRSPWRSSFAHGNLLRLYRSALKLQPDFSRLRRGLRAFLRGYFTGREDPRRDGGGLAELKRYYRRRRLLEIVRHPAYWRLAFRAGAG